MVKNKRKARRLLGREYEAWQRDLAEAESAANERWAERRNEVYLYDGPDFVSEVRYSDYEPDDTVPEKFAHLVKPERSGYLQWDGRRRKYRPEGRKHRRTQARNQAAWHREWQARRDGGEVDEEIPF